ncbi:hypothetical protein A6V05_28160 [Escherichia coli]|nr:hypothetical protein A6V12_27055 [Escherichia coli]PDU75527.1 hypothetical protein A6V05_28160 [Escherichia coli]
MTAGFNFNNYAAGFCSATPALRGNRGFLSGRSQTSEWKAEPPRKSWRLNSLRKR